MLVDIHKNNDLRNIEVNCIGICDYKLPISFKDEENKFNTIATISSNYDITINNAIYNFDTNVIYNDYETFVNYIVDAFKSIE